MSKDMEQQSLTEAIQPAAAVPRDAAVVILVRPDSDAGNPTIFWARRSPTMAFLGGFHAFPGGQRREVDSHIAVENCDDPERATMIACAVRELFEETGVLVAKGAERLTIGQLESIWDDVESRRMSFPEMLAHYGLRLDADDFTFVGRWVTPPFSPRRFDTWFFLVGCPSKQTPKVRSSEFDQGEWITAQDGLLAWQRSEILGSPPLVHALTTLGGGLTADLVDRFLATPEARRSQVRKIEFRPGFICCPVRTPTKPPATHTNSYIIGNGEVVVIDPASPYEDEQAALHACIDDVVSEGYVVREIVLTHLHPDHVGGANALVTHLKGRVPVAAHRFTAEALKGVVEVTRFIEDGDEIELFGTPSLTLKAMHTPGHARGHLCFYHEATGALITGDNIVGLGSVLIDPPEGNMRDYLHSLDRLSALPNLSVLFGAHGPAMGNPREKIQEYIRHRMKREVSILDAVRSGASTPKDIVAIVYTDVDPRAHEMAERAVNAHLDKLREDGLVSSDEDGLFTAVNPNERSSNVSQ